MKKNTRQKHKVGKKTKKEIEVPVWIKKIKINKNLLAQYVYVYLNNQRKGTVSTKTRGEVVGSTKKIYRQKGTGRARHGSIKAPIFVGGGVVGGPKPKDFSKKLNKKQKRKALIYALTLASKEDNIMTSDKLFKVKSKTKIAFEQLKKEGIEAGKERVLLVYGKDVGDNFKRAVRNINNLSYKDVNSINAYDLLLKQKIVFERKAFESFLSSLKQDENK